MIMCRDILWSASRSTTYMYTCCQSVSQSVPATYIRSLHAWPSTLVGACLLIKFNKINIFTIKIPTTNGTKNTFDQTKRSVTFIALQTETERARKTERKGYTNVEQRMGLRNTNRKETQNPWHRIHFRNFLFHYVSCLCWYFGELRFLNLNGVFSHTGKEIHRDLSRAGVYKWVCLYYSVPACT